ncbi:MAG: dTMP kinase [Dehalococcoidia bacterium]|nr:MAG: dTMP kinase [Dehalococcoidia bacterium]
MTSGRHRGVFVTLEGGEHAGKSTQHEALCRLLREAGREATACREPGGTALGERLRAALFATAPDEPPPSPEAELLTFNAARAQLVREVIRPALDRGAVVICDRFADSTVAYQQYGRGLDATLVASATAVATGGLTPDLTVLLDLDPADAARRVPTETDYLERETLAFHRRVRQGFLELAAAEPSRWLVLDGTKPAMQITHAIWERLQGLL